MSQAIYDKDINWVSYRSLLLAAQYMGAAGWSAHGVASPDAFFFLFCLWKRLQCFVSNKCSISVEEEDEVAVGV